MLLNMYRPLSPHLFIYKPQWNSICSVIHRVTGATLALGLIFFLFLFKFLTFHVTFYPLYFFCYMFNTSLAWVFISCLMILVVSFFYHLANGIRHLFWDSGRFLDKKPLVTSAYFVIFFALASSLIFFTFLS
jgi:succinate dehydrogenase / fumarate reductase cytochrome b subunit